MIALLLGSPVAIPKAPEPPTPPPADWGQALREDAQAFHDAIAVSHPGPVDVENPGFRDLLDAGLRTALHRAESADSYEHWFFALQAYSASFDDGHLGLSRYAPMGHQWRWRWPGFLTALRGNRTEVVFSAGGDRPSPGARLVSCDGRDAEEIAAELLGQGAGRWALRSRRVLVSPSLFVDSHDPYVNLPQNCTFEQDGRQKTWRLAWKPMGDEEIDQAFAAASPARHRTGVALRRLEGGYWIELGSFDPDASTEQGKQLVRLSEHILANRAAIRSASVVVFDLRGNDGGSSTWITEIAKAIWGDAWIQSRAKGADFVEWRVSDANLEAVAGNQKAYADNPEVATYLRRIAAGLGEANARGDTLWRQPRQEGTGAPDGEIPAKPVTTMRARTYVLTDHGCASACLDAVDVLLAAGATPVGQETSADTVYMEVRTEELPSGRAQVHLPMKVYRGRARGNNQTVRPDHEWTGEMSDTAGIEAWLVKLHDRG